jgi:hypothetical protein
MEETAWENELCWDDTIKMIELTEDRAVWWDLAYTVIKLQVP